MLKVKRDFVGLGYSFPDVGSLIDPPEAIRAELIAQGLAEPLETKVDPAPTVIKKKEPSASSRPARAPRKKTRKRSKKSVTKS